MIGVNVMTVFVSTLNQIAVLFSLIAAGFILAKLGILPENASKTLAKLENTIFLPALVMGTFIENFTLERIRSAWKILLVSLIMELIVIPVAIGLSKLLARDKYTQNIYTYGLCFANFGFMGNAVVSAMFPEIFFEYLIFTLPMWSIIYVWAVPVLLMSDTEVKPTVRSRLKAFANPMLIGMLIGMIIGLFGIPMPKFFTAVVDSASACMSPVAMILTGVTVLGINVKKTFTDWRIYTASVIRLVLIPLSFIGIAQMIPVFENKALFTSALCALAMPLGINTIVVPSAYGRDTSAAAGMAVISHVLSLVTIPVIFTLMG